MFRKTLVRTALAGAVMAASTVALAGPASAGQNGCMFLSFRDGQVFTQHNCGPNGNYHMDIDYPGVYRTGAEYFFNGFNRETRWADSPPRGTNVCGSLWRRKSDGGYERLGRPCEVKG